MKSILINQMNPKTINEIVAGTFTGNVNESIIQASNSGHIEVVKLLLSAGADPTTNSNYGNRAGSK